MQVQISIKTDGAAFCDVDGEPDEYAKAEEVNRIMRVVSRAIAEDVDGQVLG